MKFFDFLIIYLACGAPVGVYFYLQNRRCLYSKQLWLKTILNFLIWVPFVLQIIRKSDFLHKITREDTNSDEKVSLENEKRAEAAQKKIEKIIYTNECPISVYDFREVCERFVGLSIAVLNSTEQPSAHEAEIFRIAFRPTTELSARCYHRRNRNRLFFHQTQAEKDFLQMISQIAESVADRNDLMDLAFEICLLLKNERARDALARMFDERKQTERVLPVKELEKELWNSAKRLPPNAHPISLDSPIISRRMKSSVKD